MRSAAYEPLSAQDASFVFGRLCWCILADRDVVPDVDHLAHDVDAAFRELRGAARRSSRSRPGR